MSESSQNDGAPNIGGLTLEPVIADGELASEETRKLVYKDGDFCLFRPHSLEEVDSKDVMKIQENLSVMMSSLSTDEEVKMFKILIALRIKYWTLKSGCGVVTSFDTGLISDPGQVYTCLIDLEAGKNVILCCLSKRAEGLELFTPELDGYCQRLKERFQRLSVSASGNIEFDHDSLRSLQSWTNSITYLNNVVFNYEDYLPVLLHSALIKPVQISGTDSETVAELQLLVQACSVDALTCATEKQLVALEDDNSVNVQVVSSTELNILPSEKSEFSDMLTKRLVAKGRAETDSFQLKTIINKHKLKIIQDVNATKRLVRDAEVNYYALYRCYTYLKSTGNIDLLLKCLINDATHLKEKDSLDVLYSINDYHSKTVPVATGTVSSSNGAAVVKTKPDVAAPTSKPLIEF